MNISKINDLYKANVPSPEKTDSRNGFSQIFDRTLDEMNATTAPDPSGSKMKVIEHGDKILNLLDDYARQLNNPTKTLKDIGPLVEKIEKEVGLIESEAAAKIHDDKELSAIIKELSVTANIAVLKFQRGDYI